MMFFPKPAGGGASGSTGFEHVPVSGLRGDANDKPFGDGITLAQQELTRRKSESFHSRQPGAGSERLVYNTHEATLIADPANTLLFSSEFESGNLERAYQVYQYEYDLELASDANARGSTQWFNFSVTNAQPATYTFNLVNFVKPSSLYNKGLRPCFYSRKCKRWTSIGTNICYFKNNNPKRPGNCQSSDLYAMSFDIELTDPRDVYYLAYCYPFTYTDLQIYLRSLEEASKRQGLYKFKRDVLCTTVQGRRCDIVKISRRQKKPLKSGEKPEKKYVVVSGRVHPGETNASWVVKGMLDFLTSNKVWSLDLLDQYKFVFIPMLNPDGVAIGNYRCDTNGYDLNRCWKSPNEVLHPTIYHTKNYIRKLVMKGEVSIFFDVHGHSRKQNVFAYGNCSARRYRMKSAPKYPHYEKIFPMMMSKLCSEFAYDECTFHISKKKEGTARVVNWAELGVQLSYTIESSFVGSTLSGDGNYTINQYQELGMMLLRAIHEHGNPNQAFVQSVVAELCAMHSKDGGDLPRETGFSYPHMSMMFNDYNHATAIARAKAANAAKTSPPQPAVVPPSNPPTTASTTKPIEARERASIAALAAVTPAPQKGQSFMQLINERSAHLQAISDSHLGSAPPSTTPTPTPADPAAKPATSGGYQATPSQIYSTATVSVSGRERSWSRRGSEADVPDAKAQPLDDDDNESNEDIDDSSAQPPQQPSRSASFVSEGGARRPSAASSRKGSAGSRPGHARPSLRRGSAASSAGAPASEPPASVHDSLRKPSAGDETVPAPPAATAEGDDDPAAPLLAPMETPVGSPRGAQDDMEESDEEEEEEEVEEAEEEEESDACPAEVKSDGVPDGETVPLLAGTGEDAADPAHGSPHPSRTASAKSGDSRGSYTTAEQAGGRKASVAHTPTPPPSDSAAPPDVANRPVASSGSSSNAEVTMAGGLALTHAQGGVLKRGSMASMRSFVQEAQEEERQDAPAPAARVNSASSSDHRPDGGDDPHTVGLHSCMSMEEEEEDEDEEAMEEEGEEDEEDAYASDAVVCVTDDELDREILNQNLVPFEDDELLSKRGIDIDINIHSDVGIEEEDDDDELEGKVVQADGEVLQPVLLKKRTKRKLKRKRRRATPARARLASNAAPASGLVSNLQNRVSSQRETQGSRHRSESGRRRGNDSDDPTFRRHQTFSSGATGRTALPHPPGRIRAGSTTAVPNQGRPHSSTRPKRGANSSSQQTPAPPALPVGTTPRTVSGSHAKPVRGNIAISRRR